jgi:hypothetical protein
MGAKVPRAKPSSITYEPIHGVRLIESADWSGARIDSIMLDAGD